MRVRPAWDKWYATALWKKLRHMVLARDPVCMVCNRAPSTIADHIVPHRGDWSKFCDLANLQGICGPCHSKKTASEDGGFGNVPKKNAGPQPVPTGEPGKQFVASTIKSENLNKALDFNVDELLEGI